MNILHTVQFYEPSRGGMQTVVKQLSEQLVRRGHTVTVATSYEKERTETRINGVSVVPFHLGGNLVGGFKGDIERYRTYVRTAAPDIIVNFAAQQWATDALLPILDEITPKKIFVPTGFSALSDPNYLDYFRRMPGWMRRYDTNVFHSLCYRDAEFANQHGVKNILVIPNGAAAEEFLHPRVKDIR
jgi:glycogen synthase